jgi:hypothetical protein
VAVVSAFGGTSRIQMKQLWGDREGCTKGEAAASSMQSRVAVMSDQQHERPFSFVGFRMYNNDAKIQPRCPFLNLTPATCHLSRMVQLKDGLEGCRGAPAGLKILCEGTEVQCSRGSDRVRQTVAQFGVPVHHVLSLISKKIHKKLVTIVVNLGGM